MKEKNMNSEYIYFTADKSAPYSDAVEAGGMLYLSGLVSENPVTREELYGDITFETRTVLNNLAAFLQQLGSDIDHVVRVEILLKNWADKAAMNEEYVKHFKADHMPARVCYGGVDIAGDCKIEIMVIAAKK